MSVTRFMICGALRHGGRKESGFTLVEMLLVLLILATLAAIVVPKFAGRTEQAKITAAQTQIKSFETVLDSFEVDNGYYPKGDEGLQDLVVQPRDATKWHGPYLPEIPVDPWEHPYIFTCPGKYNPSSYDLLSLGPDGRNGTEDDIANYKTGKSR
jgi:general secretion pathway protein G